jgi:hypothetical protein
MPTYTIPRKMSGTGSIHDIASEHHDRDIVFEPGCRYAVVLASYYGGKGCTTHRTAEAAAKAAKRLGDWSYRIIDQTGRGYLLYGNGLVPA